MLCLSLGNVACVEDVYLLFTVVLWFCLVFVLHTTMCGVE